jgi:hypothetical protein
VFPVTARFADVCRSASVVDTVLFIKREEFAYACAHAYAYDPALLPFVAVAGKGDTFAVLVERCEVDGVIDDATRTKGDALAVEHGGALALRWRLAVLRALMTDPPDGDAVREAYGELVDRYRDDAAGLAQIKPLGDEIRKLEAAGKLPSTMVARSDRRRPR